LTVVLLSVLSGVSMTVNERIGEFGTLRALGLRAGDVYRLILLENLLLGVGGAAAGLVVGVALAWGLSAIGIPMPPPPNANAGYTAYIRILPGTIAAACLIGLLATVLSAMLAGRAPGRTPIVDALRRNV
jgi:putative ABC transport system permease protein